MEDIQEEIQDAFEDAFPPCLGKQNRAVKSDMFLLGL
jgi:hypothetical protein